MSLTNIRNTIAAYFKRSTTDFVVNGVDFLNVALNNARKKAERAHDFRYSGMLCQLQFASNSAIITDAVLVSNSAAVSIKRVQYVQLPLAHAGWLPIEFLTDETFQARRLMNAGRQPYQPSNQLSQYGISETKPFAVQYGQNIQLFGATYTFSLIVRLDAIVFLPDYTSTSTVVVSSASTSGYNGTYTNYGGQVNGQTFLLSTANATAIWYSTTDTRWYIVPIASLGVDNPAVGYYLDAMIDPSFGPSGPDGTYTAISGSTSGTPGSVSNVVASGSDFFITYGPEYLQWAGILETNKYFLQFVAPRQEGNIPEDTVKQLADEALQSLIAWDEGIYTGTTTPPMPPPAQPSTTVPVPTAK